ncbi:Methylthioribulose-1-phosphate dehydratase [Favolaschia claudopus]|uniref:Methylthioribulose-1-phosphate dehydratase n=1 Tax=Favolaschia claudopus TaxID=2862362 RepID=A0AAV9ZTZ7_9AGAR
MSSSESDALVLSDDPLHPANPIPALCRNFYQLGWVTGTGGGISIRVGQVYIAPSGVQKGRILPIHIHKILAKKPRQFLFATTVFVLPYPQAAPSPHTDRVFLRRPSLNLKESACTPLFWNAFELREAGSCIHTHSQNAVMATLLWQGKEFTISHQMIKGVRVGGVARALSYLDTLVVPIIENTPNEEDLKDSMAEAMKEYPDAAGVLVRRHGVYVWGSDWEKAKTQAECLDYLFEIGVKMRQAGLLRSYRREYSVWYRYLN